MLSLISFSPFFYFHRKGKTKPLDIVQKEGTGRYLDLFVGLADRQDVSGIIDVASEFVCRMYAQFGTRDVNEARYHKLIQMTGKSDEVIQLQS